MKIARLLVLAGCLLAASLFGDSFEFTEEFTGNVDEFGSLAAPLTTQKLTINVTGSMGDSDLSSFDASTGFILNLGDFPFSASLGDDPIYTPGKTKATIKIIEPGYTTSLGTVTLTWTAASFTAVISLIAPFKDSDRTALPWDVKNGAGTYSGNVAGSVFFDLASTYGNLAYTATTTVSGIKMTVKGSGIRDSLPPVIQVISPANGSEVGSNLVTVVCRVTDNSDTPVSTSVEEVLISVNGGEFAALLPGSELGRWTLEIPLQIGDNSLLIKARDANYNWAGPLSSKVTYAMASVFTLLTEGQGRVSPLTNGQVLYLNRSYSITATGTNGHKFKQWETATNGVNWAVTTNAILTFTMRSNLVAKASFIDTNRPVLIVSNLVAFQQVTNSVYVVKGKATDNVGVSNVWYRINTSPWMSVPTLSAWSAAIGLKNGANLFVAYAEDTARNYSPTTSISFICTATNFNQPPIAGTTFLSTWINKTAVITVSNVLSLCTDPDTNSLTISQVNPSTNGATVVMAEGEITYHPAAYFSGMDRFSYTVTDGLGGSATNDIRVDVYPTNRTLLWLTVTPGIPGRFSFTGFPNRNYLVQRARSLQDPWTNLMEVISDSSGAAVVEDTQAPANAGFYRAQAP